MKFFIFIHLIIFTSAISVYSQCKCTTILSDTNVVLVHNVNELQQALDLANANNGRTTILVSKGTYLLTSNLLYISPNMHHLTIRGETGNRDEVIIKGQGMNGNVTHIFNVAASNFTIANMTIGWVFYHPIQIHGEQNADSAHIQNVKIIDGNEQFIKISGGSNEPFSSDNGIIECCHFEFSAGVGNQYYTGGIDGHHCTDWIIRNNTFKNIRSPDHQLAEHAIHFWSNSKSIICENNQIMNCDRGIGFGLSNDPGRGNVGGIIRNNFVHTSRDVGIGCESSRDIKIYNNTVWTENYFNSIEYRFPENTNTHIANNLTNKAIALRDGASGILDNNFTNGVSVLFKDPVTYNFHLATKDTKLIGKGKILIEVVEDYDCLYRGLTNDIGGDQFEVITGDQDLLPSYHSISVFPNPASDYLKIISEATNPKNIRFTLINSLGEIILYEDIKKNEGSIPLVSCRDGIYYYLITEGSCLVKTGRLIIQN